MSDRNKTREIVRGWHFVRKTLRNGRPVPKDGEWLTHDGLMKMCESGLHFSPTPFQALQYAPGETLCLVEMRGDIAIDDDKGIARERRIVCRMDATELLRYYARMQALSVIHLWESDPPDVVLDYLMTGDAALMVAAEAAARAAASAAKSAAARAAARAATWAEARAAARAAASAAAGAAAGADFNALVYECFGLKDGL